MNSKLNLLMFLILVSTVSACSTPPYVHNPSEFNRNSETFANVPDDISTVIVCYSSYNAKPQDVMALAQARCSDYGKTAVFESQDYGTCPLATPVSAHYVCRVPEKKTSPYDGYNFQY
jgi:hypothetical protein